MTKPPLIPAEVMETCRVPPPKRPDWYIILYLTPAKCWTEYREGRSVPHYLTRERAEEVAESRMLRDARIVRIPGEGT